MQRYVSGITEQGNIQKGSYEEKGSEETLRELIGRVDNIVSTMMPSEKKSPSLDTLVNTKRRI